MEKEKLQLNILQKILMSDIPRIPSLSELEIRTQKLLDQNPVENTEVLEVNCPILQRYLLKENKPGSATVHILKDQVVCEKNVRQDSPANSYRCELIHFDFLKNRDVIGYGQCPYTKLSKIK